MPAPRRPTKPRGTCGAVESGISGGLSGLSPNEMAPGRHVYISPSPLPLPHSDIPYQHPPRTAQHTSSPSSPGPHILPQHPIPNPGHPPSESTDELWRNRGNNARRSTKAAQSPLATIRFPPVHFSAYYPPSPAPSASRLTRGRLCGGGDQRCPQRVDPHAAARRARAPPDGAVAATRCAAARRRDGTLVVCRHHGLCHLGS